MKHPDPRLDRLRTIAEDLRISLQAVEAPIELFDVVGVINGMISIYERTAEAGFDFGQTAEPLVALPPQIKYMEERLCCMFSRIADVKVKLKVE